jgi:two-component system NtrC family sensor kinase
LTSSRTFPKLLSSHGPLRRGAQDGNVPSCGKGRAFAVAREPTLEHARMTIRSRLTAASIIVVVLANAILAFVTAHYVNRVMVSEVQTRVRLDLNSAREIYSSQIEAISRGLQAMSIRRPLQSSLEQEVKGDLGKILRILQRETGMDMLTLVDLRGRVVYRAHQPSSSGDDISRVSIIARAIQELKPVGGTTIFLKELLEREGEKITAQALVEIQDTPEARPNPRTAERDGMVIGVAVPFPSPSSGETPLGVLFGAKLLNRRDEIVDRIKNELFQNQTYHEKDIGTATIFLGDVRISTNVRNADGTRAVGSRMSEAVADRVLLQGKVWDDRAFVVNDWYITAYEPIRDLNSTVIGALYVGLLEAPFGRPQKAILLFFLVLVGVTALAILSTLFFVTKITLKHIAPITTLCRKVIDGDLTARVGIRPPGEVGILYDAIDRMAHVIAEREEQLRRTTQQQIGQSEKLASIGRLAAGIAHEINNPLTGVLTFAHLLRQRENTSEDVTRDLDVIISETTRVRDIVRGLLDFARQSPPARGYFDINEVIQRTMQLLKSQKEFSRVTIVEDLDDRLPPVYGDNNQLQQVFLNLSLNACEAMPDGGTLCITTAARYGDVVITFSDTGHGIKKEHMDKIFDPFFTTKPVGKGTGLGLSVSYGTIQQHGGSIEVESEEGKGSVFTIVLPSKRGSQGVKRPEEGA